jgi:hypothetical protein
MNARERLIAASVPILVVSFACGAKGTVAPFAPCGSTDTCPQSTVCEAVEQTSMGVSAGPTICTWSCSNSDFDGQSCPNDATGAQGICVTSIGGTEIGDQSGQAFGFCLQDCSSGGTCPDGETCQAAQSANGGTTVCVPTPTDPLSGTSWQSSTIVPTQTMTGVATSTYTITFGTTNATVGGLASGPFSATLTQTYGVTALQHAGCTEETTFTGGTWVDMPPTSNAGALAVSNASGSTDRTNCTASSDDTTGETGDYDGAVNGQGAGYQVSGTTMTMGGGMGVTPYTDQANWTFTKM